MKTKELLLVLLLITLPIVANAQYYSGKVGETISLPNPSTPAGYNGILESRYSSSSKYLSVYSGTSSVKILSYFTGSETVRCDYTCYREVYSAGRLYYYYGTFSSNFYIKCSSSAPALQLSASPNGGQIGIGQTIKLSVAYNGSDISGCDIYYTLNGSTPSKSSTRYNSGITIDGDCTLKAIAYKEGYKTSDVLTVKYTVVDITLTADPAGGNVTKGTVVHLYSNKSNASIRYTLNGSTPTLGDPIYKPTEGIVINQSCTLKATAKINGKNNSIISTPVMEWKYTISSPKLSLSATPSGGKVNKGSVVKLAAKSDGTTVSADIYYTLNGTTPTKSSTKYTSSGIPIDSDCTLKAIAYKSGYETSNVLTSSYTIKEDVVITAKSYSRAYGDANPTFEYSVSGGTIATGEPTITCSATETSPVGTYDILVGKGTVSNDNVKMEKGTLTITPALLTVKVGNYIRQEGEDNPTFTLTYEGFKNGEDESVLTQKPTVTTSATKDSAPGDYPIMVSGGSAKNYTLSYVDGKLSVTEKSNEVTLTANSYTRVYGDANPVFEYSVSGGSITSGEPAITCSATATSPVGTYDIVISKGTIANGNVKFEKGTLTVTKAPVKIIADDKQIKQGEPLPEFTATYSGFKNSETESVLVQMPVFTCTATQNSAQGLYEISVSNAEATNYSFTYKGGTLTILPNITSDEVTVSTFSAGSLSAEIGSSAWKTIRSLTVSGQINGTDIRLIRKMLQEGKLEELNLHDAKIVSGGDSYDIYGLSKTSEDVIGESMFYNCYNLRKMELPSTTRRIEGYAFFGCSRLKQIELPETCVTVGEYAIAFCDSLSSLSIPAGLVRIGESAFTYCTSLSTIYSAIEKMSDVVSDDYYFSPFDGISDGCLWHVPAGTKIKYTSLSWWDRNWGIVEDFESSASAIENVITDKANSEAWYTLRGMKLDNKPTIPGIYIYKGKKVVVR